MKTSPLYLFANWLIDTTRGHLVLKIGEWMAFCLGMLASAFVVWQAETMFMPVIKNWRIDYVTREDNKWVVGGVMTKARACELVATSIMAVPKMPLAPRILIYQIKPSEILGGNTPVGTATWGPWEMKIPDALEQHRDDISFLEIVGHHRCHAFWLQETIYGTVRLSDLP